MNIEQQFGSWYKLLKNFIHSNEFINIANTINKDRLHYTVIPEQGSDLFFKVFKETEYDNLKVVILGQDPYSNPVNAYDGLAFSNSTLITPQPSLINILNEVEYDIYDGFNIERIGDLSLYNWAKQGVLLLNSALSVKQHLPSSHLKIWKNFTSKVINVINQKDDIIWLLWGRKAQSYQNLINNPSHNIIETAHPSPLGCSYNAPIPFIKSKCFSKCNYELKIRNKKEIIW